MNRLLILLFLGVSLQSHYFYNLGMPLISVASLFMMAVVLLASTTDGLRFPLNAASGVTAAYLVILFWSGVGLLVYGDVASPKRIIAFAIIILAAMTGVMLFRRVPVETLIRGFLIVHVGAFFLQTILFYTTGYILDFLAPITGEEQRIRGGSFTLPFIGLLVRPTGLYVEPGTYATFVGPFVALFERWYDRSVANKRLFWTGLGSLVVSLSVFGIIFAALTLLFSKRLSVRVRIIAVATGGVLAAPFMYYRFVVIPSLGIESGMGFRQVFIQESMLFLWTDPRGFAFGSNLLVLDPRASFVAAFNDVGMIFYFLHFAGPILTLVIGSALVYAAVKLDRSARIALLIVVISKQALFAPFFALTLISLFWKSDQDDGASKTISV